VKQQGSRDPSAIYIGLMGGVLISDSVLENAYLYLNVFDKLPIFSIVTTTSSPAIYLALRK
jgi:hypothetical protein